MSKVPFSGRRLAHSHLRSGQARRSANDCIRIWSFAICAASTRMPCMRTSGRTVFLSGCRETQADRSSCGRPRTQTLVDECCEQAAENLERQAPRPLSVLRTTHELPRYSAGSLQLARVSSTRKLVKFVKWPVCDSTGRADSMVVIQYCSDLYHRRCYPIPYPKLHRGRRN